MDPRMTAALQEAAIPYREGEPLSRHTTMGVGGPAAVMAFPRDAEELRTHAADPRRARARPTACSAAARTWWSSTRASTSWS